MGKKWIRNKPLLDAYDSPIRVQDYEKPNLGLTDRGPHPQDPNQRVFDIARTDMDTSLALQHFANSILSLPLRDTPYTAKDLERTQTVLRAAIQCRRENTNFIAVDDEEHDWLLSFFKQDKYASVIARLYSQNSQIVKEALEETLRPEQRTTHAQPASEESATKATSIKERKPKEKKETKTSTTGG